MHLNKATHVVLCTCIAILATSAYAKEVIPIGISHGGAHLIVEVAVNISDSTQSRNTNIASDGVQNGWFILDTGSAAVQPIGRSLCNVTSTSQNSRLRPACMQLHGETEVPLSILVVDNVRVVCAPFIGSTTATMMFQNPALRQPTKIDYQLCTASLEKLTPTNMQSILWYYNGTSGSLGLGMTRNPASQSHHSSPPAMLDQSFSRTGNKTAAIYSRSRSQARLEVGADLTYEGFFPAVPLPVVPEEVQLHYLTMFDLKICGASVFGDVSSFWPVMVDTGAQGLLLPSRLFDNVMNWLRPTITCNEEHVCHLRREEFEFYDYDKGCAITKKPLPTFSFKIRENASPEFRIPIGDLIDEQQRVWIIRGEDEGSSIRSITLISLGSRAVRNFAVGLDYAYAGVSLKPEPQAIIEESEYYCASKAVCKGSQEYVESSNSCSPPRCDLLYFHNVDDKGEHCEVSSLAAGLLVACLVMLWGTEVVLGEWRRKLTVNIINGFPLATRAHRD